MRAGREPMTVTDGGRDPTTVPPATQVALLDVDGVITEVNQAWREFCLANGGDPAATGPGVSYLGVCAAAAGDPAADEVAAAISAAVAGALAAPVSVLVPGHSPE